MQPLSDDALTQDVREAAPKPPVPAEPTPVEPAPVPGGTESANAVTTVIVKYPSDAMRDRRMALRGDAASLSWFADTEGDKDGDVTVFKVTAPRGTSFELKPVLVGADVVWSQGANFKANAGETVEVTPYFWSHAGRVELLFDGFRSTLLANSRRVWAYVPPSYDENPYKRYPVLYMHDGQNCFDPSMAFGGTEWRVDETVTDGINAGWLPEVLVVMIANTSARMSEYTPTFSESYGFGGRGDEYLAFLTDELLPETNRWLRTKTGPDNTGLMGSSLGGLISVYAGVERPDVFGRIGGMSPSTWWDDRFIIGHVRDHMGAAPNRPSRIYVDSGNAGNSKDDVVNTTTLAETLRQLGFEDEASLRHVVQDGGVHAEYYWAQRLPGALWFLFHE